MFFLRQLTCNYKSTVKPLLYAVQNLYHTIMTIPVDMYHKKSRISKRASLFFSNDCVGSMTLEASLVIPIFLFFFFTLLWIIEIIGFQSVLQEALFQAGNEAASNGYLVWKEKDGRLNITEKILNDIEKQQTGFMCVDGGKTGVNIAVVYDQPVLGMVDVTASCKIKSFVGVIPMRDIVLQDQLSTHEWIGYRGGGQGSIEQEKDVYVYITKTGVRYHLYPNCVYLKVNISSMFIANVSDARNENGEKYGPCRQCTNGNEQLIFITVYGNRYHGKSNCTSLKRDVFIIPLSQVGSRTLCSKCAT